MKTPNEVRKRKSLFKPKNEKGSVTLFVLIAMLFLLTVGLIIFITNVNSDTAQRKDRKKIQEEYNNSANSANLDNTYNEQEAKVTNKIQIVIKDSEGNLYKGENWTNKIPLTVEVIWPNEIKKNATDGTNTKEIKVAILHGLTPTTTTYKDNQIANINLVDDGTYNIFAQVNDNKAQVTVKIDATAPTVTFSPNGGNTYINPRTRKLLEPIEITAEDPLSGVEKIEYITSNSTTAPAANDQNWTIYNKPIDEIPNADDGEIWYVYAKVTDKVGNVDIIKSPGYTIKLPRAKFAPGVDVNVKMKQLAGNEGTITHDTVDQLITKIELSETLPSQYENNNYNIASQDSQLPIYMWAEDDPNNSGKKIIKYFTDDMHPFLNEDASYMFDNLYLVASIPQLNQIDTTKTTNMQGLFKDLRAVTSLDVSNFYTARVRDMSYLFRDCFTLTTIDVSSFNTANVETMAYMFAGDRTNLADLNTAQDYSMHLTSISGLDRFNTTKVTSMSYMFMMCTSITSLDLRSFDTQNVVDFSAMFYGSWNSGKVNMALTEIKGLDTFNTSKAENMQTMFGMCSNLSQINVTSFNTSNVTNMVNMFLGCSGITELDLRNFDTRKVTNMYQMFNACSNLIRIYATDNFSTAAVTNSTNMFSGCTHLVGGSGTTYDSGKIDKTYARIDNKGTDNQGNILKGYFTNHYFIKYEANTDNTTGTMTNQGIPFSYATNLKENGFTKEGYIFRGWNTKADGTGTSFADGASMNYDLAGIKALVQKAEDKADDKNVTLTLYAMWSVKHYEVTNGNTVLPAETLEEAISIAETAIDGTTVTTATIAATMDYTDNSTATVTKNIVLDLAGHTIERNTTITNNGTLDIYSSVDNGKITSSADIAIISRGTLTTNGTSDAHTLTIENTTTIAKSRVIQSYTDNVTNTTINKNTTLQFTQPISSGTEIRYIIMSQHNTTINGATLKTTTSGTAKEFGISIPSASTNGRIIINDGTTIDVTGYALYNNGSTKKGNTPAIEVNGEHTDIKSRNNNTIYNNSDGDVKINAGTIYSSYNAAIYNSTTGTINVNGGTVKGETYSVTSKSSGYLSFNGGTLTGKSHDKTYDGREVTFDVPEANVTPKSGYKPYTRQNGQYYETVLEKEVTVTADATGGAIKATTGWTGTGATATKKVLQNAPYGTLPTANEMERTGYSFVGWNGKNKFSGLVKGKKINSINGAETNADDGALSDFIPVDFSTDNVYYISGLANTLYSCVGAYNKDKVFIGRTSGAERRAISLNNNSFNKATNDALEDKDIKYIRVTQYVTSLSTSQSIDTIDSFNIQVEEGTTATAYEPYIITDSTLVTKDTNHTIKAVWEANNYLVTADANGGNIPATTGWTGSGATATKTVKYDSVYGNLPQPTRTGYDFDGWYKENTFQNKVQDSTTYKTAANSTIFAKWNIVTYNITYNMNNGTNHASNPATYTVETPTINLQQPTKSGSTFFGWSVNEGTNKLTNMISKDDEVTINNGTYTFTNATDGNKYGFVKLQLLTTGNCFIYAINTKIDNGKIYGIYDHKLDSGTYRLEFATNGNKKDARVFYNIDLVQGKKYYYEFETTKATEQEYIAKDFKFVEATGNVTASIPKGSTGDKSFTAYWYANQYTYQSYTATFDVNGGNELAQADRTRTLQYGTPLGALPQPTRTGYDFAGWFTAATGGTQISDATKMGAANVTYFAHWTAKKYTVTYNPKGGTVTPTSKEVTYDSAYGDLPSGNNITRTGYTFAGWYKEEAYTNKVETSTIVKTADNHTLYAKWTANPYTVTADANGGTIASTTGWTGTGNTATKSVNYDAAYGTLPSVSKTGYQFKGWNGKNLFNIDALNSNYTDVTKEENDWIHINTKNKYDYYGYFTKNLDIAENTEYTVITEVGDTANLTGDLYVTSDHAGVTQFPSYTLNSDKLQKGYVDIKDLKTKTNVTTNAGLRTFYHNKNKNTNEQLSFRLSVLNKQEITSSDFRYEPYYLATTTPVTTAKAHTIKAIWEANKYTVVFNKNSDSATGTMSNQQFTYDQAQNLTSNGFSRTGYTFKGWATTPTGTVAHTNGKSVSNLTTTNNGTVNLYAVWEANKYKLSFNKNSDEATGTMYDQEIVYDTNATINTNAFTRTNYYFSGWNTAADGSGTSYANNASIRNLLPSGTLVLYAQWIESHFTVDTTAMYLNLTGNKTGQINVTKSQYCVLEFTSLDPTIATVNSSTGAVTAVKSGTVTINVKDINTNVTQTCTVYVDTLSPKWTITVKSVT